MPNVVDSRAMQVMSKYNCTNVKRVFLINYEFNNKAAQKITSPEAPLCPVNNLEL